ncbi:MAG: hypothetical protein AAF993_19100, partial [Pseudomonadota bacterium]
GSFSERVRSLQGSDKFGPVWASTVTVSLSETLFDQPGLINRGSSQLADTRTIATCSGNYFDPEMKQLTSVPAETTHRRWFDSVSNGEPKFPGQGNTYAGQSLTPDMYRALNRSPYLELRRVGRGLNFVQCSNDNGTTNAWAAAYYCGMSQNLTDSMFTPSRYRSDKVWQLETVVKTLLDDEGDELTLDQQAEVESTGFFTERRNVYLEATEASDRYGQRDFAQLICGPSDLTNDAQIRWTIEPQEGLGYTELFVGERLRAADYVVGKTHQLSSDSVPIEVYTSGNRLAIQSSGLGSTKVQVSCDLATKDDIGRYHYFAPATAQSAAFDL